MADLKTLTKNIQRYVGVTADGEYGPNTARAVLVKLRSTAVTVTEPEGTSTESDAGFPEVFKATPNVSSSTIQPEGVVLHHSYGSYIGGVEWILNADSNVSYHALIDMDGSRTVFANDTQRAWHAGVSSFNGKKGCNNFMLGLAFSGDTYTRVLTPAEIDSAVEFLLPRFKRWGWPKDLSTITTHRDVSPNRKVDVDIRAEEVIMKALKKALI